VWFVCFLRLSGAPPLFASSRVRRRIGQNPFAIHIADPTVRSVRPFSVFAEATCRINILAVMKPPHVCAPEREKHFHDSQPQWTASVCLGAKAKTRGHPVRILLPMTQTTHRHWPILSAQTEQKVGKDVEPRESEKEPYKWSNQVEFGGAFHGYVHALNRGCPIIFALRAHQGSVIQSRDRLGQVGRYLRLLDRAVIQSSGRFGADVISCSEPIPRIRPGVQRRQR